MTCVAFSIKFARTNQKFAENSEFCEKNHYYSELFTSLLRPDAAAADGPGLDVDAATGDELKAEVVRLRALLAASADGAGELGENQMEN